MITFFVYNKIDGLIVAVISGSTYSVGDQSIPDTQDLVYGVAAQPGQYYDVATGVVSDTPITA